MPVSLPKILSDGLVQAPELADIVGLYNPAK